MNNIFYDKTFVFSRNREKKVKFPAARNDVDLDHQHGASHDDVTYNPGIN